MRIFFLTLCAFIVAMTANAQPQPLSAPPVNVSWTAIAVLPTTTGTLTARQMVGIGAAAVSGASSFTTPTATQLCALFPTVGASNQDFNWDWYLRNTASGADAITMLAGSGVTLSGTMTVAQNAVKHFKISIRNCGGTPAAVLYSLGSSTF